MKAKHKVLSTKTLEPAVVEMARKEGIDVLEQEAIRVQPILTKEKWNEVSFFLEKKIEYAVFTSSNAVDALKKYTNEYVNYLPAQWKTFCVSGKTKALLSTNEDVFGTVVGAAPDASQLAELIIEKGVKEILFFCGNKRRDELFSSLAAAGIKVHEVVVYETIETPVVTEPSFDAVLFFSPSAVQSFFTVNQLTADTICFAIGQTTAHSIASHVPNKIFTSNEPTQESLLKEVIAYFKISGNSPPVRR